MVACFFSTEWPLLTCLPALFHPSPPVCLPCTGAVLKQVAENAWAAERPFVWLGIDVGGCMAVLRLSDGSLWVHSPVQLDDDLAAALAELGEVKHIVTPNYEHTKYAKQWIERYPGARSYACPGLKQKEPEVPYTTELGGGGGDPPEWLGEVQSTWLSYERNPFNGKPFFNEVGHTVQGICFLTDLKCLNYPSQVPGGTKLFKFGMDRIYLPVYRNFMIKEKGEYVGAMQRIFEEWDFDAILPCHGDFVSKNGKEVLRKHLKLQ
ncbi:hypothetical protein COCSUDRAFT_20322 [Coccomyxa subellipsoidea C-169]|uniref:Metallo-beta-lactamase domain-containing protein n=1 Tax=Coccomyxa subellipsoidea (strain C-169) TaxID=574566 RepID=I0YJY9_COCSC|nr:hypothetical protein COCSUDRAFT_20322 [Coccomyxa subellipsoidea C-169]EIE18708.1 hypothetical protein COCSUDRAFT_20322 [Coccomyxa subellipsoidea C-169]|eukprot:XP_005643252.1 hypothetical protein COCSUDRAFT_20322 [Coccomyxa subellipsoidea C-169]